MFRQSNQLEKSQATTIFKENATQIKIKCSSGKQKARQFCINEKCTQQSKFTCAYDTCQCQTKHEFCSNAKISGALKNIEKKILQVDSLKDLVEKTIDRMIDQLSEVRQKLLYDIQNSIKYIGLFKVEKQFLKFAKEEQNNHENIFFTKSKSLWSAVNSKNEDGQISFNRIKELIQKLQKTSKNTIDNFMKQFEIVKKKEKTATFLINKSSIMKSVQLSQRMINFFQTPLKKISLIFKASDHGFNLNKFYELCGKETNTVIICQSNKGKIVGGYTPFSHYQENLTQDIIQIADPEGKSFMFSLTNNDKFLLDNKNKAIKIQKDKSRICFGCTQIVIYNNSNTNQNCQLDCSRNYKNKSYKSDKDGYLRFNGNDSYKCTIKEWEVWKIQFQDQQS